MPSGDWSRKGLGDWIDPYFINSLLEQWWYSLTHLQSPASPPVFFPARGTLGYSHSLVLYAPLYTLARVWLHPFTAYTATLFAIVEIGTLSLYVVFRRFVRLGVAESVLFTAMFATSANVINGGTGVWSQRASIFLVPPMLLLGLAAARWPRGPSRSAGLACTGLLAASLLTHDVYTGLLSVTIAALLIIGSHCVLRWPRIGVRLTLWRVGPPAITGRRRALAVAALVVAALSLAIAAQHQFGNVRHRHPGRALAVAAAAAIAFELIRGGARDRIAVADPSAALDTAAISLGALGGLGVFVWMYAAAFSQHPGFSTPELLEHLSTGTLLPFDSGRSCAIVFVLAVAAWVPWLPVSREVRLSAAWFAGVTAVALVIPVRIGGFAPWTYVAESVPGFAAIRDPRRIQYPFELAAALAAGLFTAQLPRASAQRRMVALFVLAVLAVNWNRERFDYERPLDAFRTFVEAPISIDGACRSFFMTRARSPAYTARSPNLWALYANDAAFIAAKYAIPTLNGYSAWTPPDWHLFNPADADYAPAVAQWVARNRLDHVCVLDIDRRTMTPYSPAASGASPR